MTLRAVRTTSNSSLRRMSLKPMIPLRPSSCCSSRRPASRWRKRLQGNQQYPLPNFYATRLSRLCDRVDLSHNELLELRPEAARRIHDPGMPIAPSLLPSVMLRPAGRQAGKSQAVAKPLPVFATADRIEVQQPARRSPSSVAGPAPNQLARIPARNRPASSVAASMSPKCASAATRHADRVPCNTSWARSAVASAPS